MHRAIWLPVILLACAACESRREGVFIREADFEAVVARETPWSATLGPQEHNHESHVWYLDYIRNRALEQGFSTIAQLCEDRIATRHPHHTDELSWTRIQLAYRLSRIDEWSEVTQKLSGVPGDAWTTTPFTPTDPPEVSKSAATVLDETMTDLIATTQVTETDLLVAPATTQQRVDYRKKHIYTSYYGPANHSYAAAWMHTWMARQYAKIPKASTPPGSLAPEWIICEIDHN